MTAALSASSQPRARRASRRKSSGPRRAADPAVGTRHRALIVDDDEDTRELYAWSLRAAGWLVEAVANGEEVLFVAAAFAADVIVMDLRMPVIDGVEATRRLKANPFTRHIPVVAISGSSRGQAEALSREAGCEAYVVKPCRPERLRVLLESLVAGRGALSE
jgi:two-component system, cell cycle response regulator DivK